MRQQAPAARSSAYPVRRLAIVRADGVRFQLEPIASPARRRRRPHDAPRRLQLVLPTAG